MKSKTSILHWNNLNSAFSVFMFSWNCRHYKKFEINKNPKSRHVCPFYLYISHSLLHTCTNTHTHVHSHTNPHTDMHSHTHTYTQPPHTCPPLSLKENSTVSNFGHCKQIQILNFFVYFNENWIFIFLSIIS